MPSKNRKRKSNNDTRVEEAYKFMQSIQENVKSKDDFAVYGENVASRMRGANQSSQAISIAKNRIDNILFQLEMGEFAIREVNTMSSLNRCNRVVYHPPNAASPTFSSASLPLSSPSPSPSATSSQSVHSFQILQPQNHSGPQSFITAYRGETPWQTYSYNDMPETRQPQSQMSLQQQNFNTDEQQQTQQGTSLTQQPIGTPQSRSTMLESDIHEFLIPKEKSSQSHHC